MKALRYITILLIASLAYACETFDEREIAPTIDPSTTTSTVTRLEDGRLQVRGRMEASSMTQIATRATDIENTITNGWCLVFGQNSDHAGSAQYSDVSPLIQKEQVTINANGEFVVTLSEYKGIAFMRIVANLSEREKDALKDTKSWRSVNTDSNGDLNEDTFINPPTADDVSKKGITTFKDYRDQSAGLDGLYDMEYNTGVIVGSDGTVTYSPINENKPNPANLTTNGGFPITSYGIILNSITEEGLKEHLGNTIYMIRSCSKVMVEAVDNTFTMNKIYLLGAAQEVRLRSTVLENQSQAADGTIFIDPDFEIPTDLGGSIDYEPLEVSGSKSDPIYFYPNKGGYYPQQGDTTPDNINPQYIIVYGQSSRYDTPGYYKLALKAQYPLSNLATEGSDKNDRTLWSALTYDIIRNTAFTVKLLSVDKPGYKTYEDAAAITSPANNISYSIVIESNDSRNEVLVSSGTYYAEIETSRVYIKGYMDEGVGYEKDDTTDDCYVDFKMISAAGHVTPAVYIQASGYDAAGNNDYASDDIVVTGAKVLYYDNGGTTADKWWEGATSIEKTKNESDSSNHLDDEWFMVPASEKDKSARVRVYFKAKSSGRLRLRIGDMLKFIPVVYDPLPISIYGTKGQNGNDSSDPGIVVNGDNGVTWSDFKYSKESDIEYDYAHVPSDNKFDDFKIGTNGKVAKTNFGVFNRKPELRARIHPATPGDGVAVIYLRQASDFRLVDKDDKEYDQNKIYNVAFTAKGTVYNNGTDGLFTTTLPNKESIVFDSRKESGVVSDSVDPVTISVKTVPTAGDTDSDGNFRYFFKEKLSEKDQVLTLKVEKQNYNNQAYTTKPTNMVTMNYVAMSTVTIKNSAGDSKTYKVQQTQYPPVYIVAPKGETKEFKADGKPKNNEENLIVVYVINLYNYDSSASSGYSVSTTWTRTSSDVTSFNRLKNIMYESTLSAIYLRAYVNHKTGKYRKNFLHNWTYYDYLDGTDFPLKQVSSPTAISNSRLAELEPCGADLAGASATYALIRSRDQMNNNNNLTQNVYVTVDVTVTDMYGETYTAQKKIIGLND